MASCKTLARDATLAESCERSVYRGSQDACDSTVEVSDAPPKAVNESASARVHSTVVPLPVLTSVVVVVVSKDDDGLAVVGEAAAWSVSAVSN